MRYYSRLPKNNWLNQSNSDFDSLLPLANRETKFAEFASDERAVFKLYSLGVDTANRDEWTFTTSTRAPYPKKFNSSAETYQLLDEVQRFGLEKPEAEFSWRLGEQVYQMDSRVGDKLSERTCPESLRFTSSIVPALF